jgi:hypothetical protein
MRAARVVASLRPPGFRPISMSNRSIPHFTRGPVDLADPGDHGRVSIRARRIGLDGSQPPAVALLDAGTRKRGAEGDR